MPKGYVAQEIADQQTGTIGVNVFRNNNNVVWRYIPSSSSIGQVQINDIVDFELNQIVQFHSFDGSPDVIVLLLSNLMCLVFLRHLAVG